MAICGNQLEIDHLLLPSAIASNRRFDKFRPYHRIGSGIKVKHWKITADPPGLLTWATQK